MSRESKTSIKKKSSKSPSKTSRSDSPSATPSTVKKNPSLADEEDGGGANKDDALGTPARGKSSEFSEGIQPLPSTPSATETATKTTTPKTPSTTTTPASDIPSGHTGPLPTEDDKTKKKGKYSHTPKKGRGGGTPRGGHHGSKPRRGELKFGERPSIVRDSVLHHETHPADEDDDDEHFDPRKFQRMSALYFHKHNDLSRSARGVGYTPDQAVPKYGPGVTDEAESLYGPCKLLTDFQYSTWTETVVPLRNHNVVQGFNEMILFLIKLAADPDGPVNHEEAFMATSFLANIRNDLGEHPPNVLALLEYIDCKTLDDGTEPADPEIEVITPCKAAERY